MLIRDFFNMLLDDTLEHARERFLSHPAEELEFKAAELAVEECRSALLGNRLRENLLELVREARGASAEAQAAGWPDVAFWFAREVQIEGVSDVVSVILLQRRLPTVIPPTRQAAIRAARIAGALP